MTSLLFRRWVAGGWCTAAVASALAQPTPAASSDAADRAEPVVAPAPQAIDTANTELPEIRVRAKPAPRAETIMAPTSSRTTLNDAALRRRQADSVFQVMDEVPGVTVQGGPRNSGMTFNIRGYSDTEDVRIELDGVTKGFEKYRFGGTFIEPELLKAIEVQRGAQIESPGALGGTVRATTRDARDLLRPGQTWGARAKLGWASNNHEQHRFATAYGRPSEQTDVVLGISQRDGDNLKLSNGQRLPLSEVNAGSHLLKGSWWAHDALKLSASWVGYRDQGLQAYDTYSGVAGTGSSPTEQVGSFGQVQRRIDDDTLSLQALWTNEAQGHEWLTTVGRSETRVRDHFEPGWSIFSLNSRVDDDIRQTHHTVDSRLTLGLWRGEGRDQGGGEGRDGLSLKLGGQWGDSEREALRVTSNPVVNNALYPGGYNQAQPPGRKRHAGAYAQLDWRWGRWQVLPGTRFDVTQVSVMGRNAEILQAAGAQAQVRYADWSPSLTLSYALQPGRWTGFITAARSHRPPLIDEAFMRAGFGVCNNNTLLRVQGSQPRVPGYAAGAQVAPSTGICAASYEPEISHSLEWGLHTRQPDVLGPGSWLQAKATAFSHRTEHLLESLMAEPGGSGRLIQPGWERRQGLELEASLGWQQWQTRLAASHIQGTQFDGLSRSELVGAPADRIHLSLSRQTPWGEWGLRWQQVWSRTYYTDNARTQTADSPSYRLLGASLSWRVNRHLEASLVADNLNNSAYLLDNGFNGGPGTEGPGRNVKLAISARY